MIKMQRVYQYEDDEGTWFEETVPLMEFTVDELLGLNRTGFKVEVVG